MSHSQETRQGLRGEHGGSFLSTAFDPKLNALNTIRLLLAVSVIVWHSVPLTGAARPGPAVAQLLGDGGVDGFFAISGFLIVSSWMRRPRWWPYLKARFLRILPAFWMCLIVTAAIIAPLGIYLAGQDLPDGYPVDAALYVGKNALLKINEYGISGTPTGVPYPGVWNGSLWTLCWEFLCYLGVLALGLTRFLRYRATIPIIFAACLTVTVLADVRLVHNYYLVNGSRFGLMFAAGALIYQLRDRLPARAVDLVMTAGIVAAASLLPDYRLAAALPLAYLLIAAGALLRIRALRLRNDISYGTYIYAFPVQQVLASAGLYRLGVPLFASIAIPLTLLVAAASWFGVEKPAMRLRGRAVPTPLVPAPSSGASSRP
ncbi:acyltransferase family protein [Leifsonia sp. NPDC056665]|uniref:acyltransferase family protein n=1 Tax=Leifsonia sp. NPDC056665 TaxID=3345901 RepID=UPI0036843B6E